MTTKNAFPEMWRHVNILLTDVSEERIASIFRVDTNRHLLTLVHRSRISYTLKMEAMRSSETSVNKISTRRHIPKDGILHESVFFFLFMRCSL
jgi:hypothetical protein